MNDSSALVSSLPPNPSPAAPRRLGELDGSARAALFRSVRVIATDVDGTLTRGRALDPEVVRVIAALARRGLVL